MSDTYRKFLRLKQLPHVWCPGCGNGTIVKALLEAIQVLGYRQDDVVMISGIGCSGRTPTVLDFNTMHTTHGRALAFAAGIKLADPRLKVIVIMGDGDASAIGGNHLIHACRRNLDLTALIFNNAIYGLTGGQQAPTTPSGKRSTTSTLGSIEQPFDLVRLCLGAGAGFVARTTSFDHRQMSQTIRRAIEYPGFSVVDVITACPTYYGRMNDLGEPYEMLHYLRDTTSPLDACGNGNGNGDGDEAGVAGAGRGLTGGTAALPTGVFRDEVRPDYGTLYRQVVETRSAKGGKS